MPEFVLLGGLVPELLCTRSNTLHIGTTDVDVQVNLEIVNGSTNTVRLENALRNAGFTPERERVWRWNDVRAPGLIVKAEFLTDLDDVRNHTTVTFDNSQLLGAINIRGTGYAARDWEVRQIESEIDGKTVSASLRVANVAGFLLTKIHAAHDRHAVKDWYDIAFVLIHNDVGGPRKAGELVSKRFGTDLVGQTRTAIDELASNFTDQRAFGTRAYADTMLSMNTEEDWDIRANDAVAAISEFVAMLKSE